MITRRVFAQKRRRSGTDTTLCLTAQNNFEPTSSRMHVHQCHENLSYLAISTSRLTRHVHIGKATLKICDKARLWPCTTTFKHFRRYLWKIWQLWETVAVSITSNIKKCIVFWFIIPARKG